MTLSQISAIVIFLAMFIVLIIGRIQRFIPALIGAALTVFVVFLLIMRSPQSVVNAFNIGQIVKANFWVPGHTPVVSHGVNWQTIFFIGGMMVMVEGLAQVGFFRWMCLFVAKAVKYKVIPIFVSFFLLSGFLSMFIDSITVMLFLATVTIELGRLLKFDPVPMIIAEIAAANTGGSATMAGDPPNVIIGTGMGFTFTDFAVNTGPLAWAGIAISLVFFYLVFRKKLSSSGTNNAAVTPNQYPQPKEAINNPMLFVIESAIMLLVIVLLITHAQTGISFALIGFIAAGLTLLVSRKTAANILKKVDWRTLLFFFGLFLCVSGLEETGSLKMMAKYIGDISGGSALIVMTIILWSSAFLSSIIDNIPFAATMVPIVQNLTQARGFSPATLSWALALGTDIGGNGTPIGASANVVATAIAEKEGYPIGWGKFCKYAYPAMIIVIGLIQVLMMVRYL
jgi:Na+/H+ antiporter NhaD/arsenite permease-like protein